MLCLHSTYLQYNNIIIIIIAITKSLPSQLKFSVLDSISYQYNVLFIMAHRWLQMASKHLVQLKIHSFSRLFLFSFFILVNPRIHKCTGNFWTGALFIFWFRLQCGNLLGTLFLCPQNELRLLLTLSLWELNGRVVHRAILFHPFLYFLNICVDCCRF